MNAINHIMVSLDVAQARYQALVLRSYITRHTAKVMPLLWTKAFAVPEPVPQTVWEKIVAKIQSPVAVPAYLLYFMVLILSLDVIFGAWNVWDLYGKEVMDLVARKKLAEAAITRYHNAAIAIRKTSGEMWKFSASTASRASHRGEAVLGSARIYMEAGVAKIKQYNLKTPAVEKDAKHKGRFFF
jgi:hypothetical protein